MRAAVYGLLGVLLFGVLVSVVCRDSVDAQCASTNDLVASDDGAETNSQGHFTYTLTVDSWDLTFTPIGLILDLEPSGGSINVEDVQFTPDSVIVSSYGCINDTDIDIDVDGDLKDDSKDGVVNANIKLSAGGSSTYSEPWPTFIPRP